MKETVQMSIKEADRLSIMKQLDKKLLTLRKGGEELGLSLRQTKRIRKRYLEVGDAGLISRKRGKPSNRKIAESTQIKALELIKNIYVGFGPTLASEKLRERDGITISAETIRKWLIGSSAFFRQNIEC